MTLKLPELFNSAIMTSTPMIIVEGSDDVGFYESVLNHVSKEGNVYAIENILNYAEGCSEVIRAIQDLQSRINEKNKQFLLGIIDGDVHYYRNTTPKLKCIFILKYYSFESHFISQANLKILIGNLISNSKFSTSKEVMDYCNKEIDIKFRELYYYSLEALKKSLKPNYASVVSYSTPAGTLYCNHFFQAIKQRKYNLNYFARSKKIVFDMNNLKKIAKGKWLLHYFAASSLSRLNNLSLACNNGEITQCQFCSQGKPNKCLRRLNSNYNVDNIKSKLLSMFDEREFRYIFKRFNKLGNLP